MKAATLLIGLALAGCSAAQPEATPSARTTVSVVSETSGACSDISIQPEKGPPAVLGQACHGWTMKKCGAGLLAVAGGVRVDQAVLVVETRAIDLAAAVNREMTQRWPGRDLFNLTFNEADCAASLSTIGFGAASTPPGGGSADPVTGRLVVDRAGLVLVTFDPASPAA